MLNKFIDLERLTTFFQGLKDIFLQKSEASTTYATKTEVGNKVDKVDGKGLSTLDYNESEKSKVDNSINQVSVTQNTNNVELNLSKTSGNVTAYIDEATPTKAGALSNTDKSKLDAIPSDPKYTDTIYVHPTNHSASMITESASRRFVSDTEKADWNNKQDKLTSGTNVTITGTTISATDTVYDDTELKTRITAVENREDKDTTYNVATTTTNGLMSSADKTKVNGIPTNPKYTDTIYTHPTSHSADMITETQNKAFITEQERLDWNNKLNPTDVLSDAKVEVEGQQVGLTEHLETINDFKNSKGQADGIAELDDTGKVPASQLPPVPNLTLNELTLGGRFKIVYNDIQDSLDIEVI